jgi:hypothetical protein
MALCERDKVQWEAAPAAQFHRWVVKRPNGSRGLPDGRVRSWSGRARSLLPVRERGRPRQPWRRAGARAAAWSARTAPDSGRRGPHGWLPRSAPTAGSRQAAQQHQPRLQPLARGHQERPSLRSGPLFESPEGLSASGARASRDAAKSVRPTSLWDRPDSERAYNFACVQHRQGVRSQAAAFRRIGSTSRRHPGPRQVDAGAERPARTAEPLTAMRLGPPR